MITPACPSCRRIIPPDDVNPGTDTAYCRSCNLAARLSFLVRNMALPDLGDTFSSPRGTWLEKTGFESRAGATYWSIGGAVGALFICLFWNGIVSVFVLLALASTLQHLGLELPEWFPAPTMEGEGMPLGMTIFLWIFLTPFIAVGLLFLSNFFLSLAGKTEVRVTQGGEGVIFTGIGPFGFKKRFDPLQVESVSLQSEQNSDGNGKEAIHLNLRDGGQTKFGSLLPSRKKSYLAAAVQEILRP